MRWIMRLAALFLPLLSISAARAEVGEVIIAQQYGVSFLPLMVMERNQLIEKHARHPACRICRRNG